MATTRTTQTVTLGTGTASGAAGSSHPHFLRRVTATGSTLAFDVCYWDSESGDNLSPSSSRLAASSRAARLVRITQAFCVARRVAGPASCSRRATGNSSTATSAIRKR